MRGFFCNLWSDCFAYQANILLFFLSTTMPIGVPNQTADQMLDRYWYSPARHTHHLELVMNKIPGGWYARTDQSQYNEENIFWRESELNKKLEKAKYTDGVKNPNFQSGNIVAVTRNDVIRLLNFVESRSDIDYPWTAPASTYSPAEFL